MGTDERTNAFVYFISISITKYIYISISKYIYQYIYINFLQIEHITQPVQPSPGMQSTTNQKGNCGSRLNVLCTPFVLQ